MTIRFPAQKASYVPLDDLSQKTEKDELNQKIHKSLPFGKKEQSSISKDRSSDQNKLEKKKIQILEVKEELTLSEESFGKISNQAYGDKLLFLKESNALFTKEYAELKNSSKAPESSSLNDKINEKYPPEEKHFSSKQDAFLLNLYINNGQLELLEKRLQGYRYDYRKEMDLRSVNPVLCAKDPLLFDKVWSFSEEQNEKKVFVDILEKVFHAFCIFASEIHVHRVCNLLLRLGYWKRACEYHKILHGESFKGKLPFLTFLYKRLLFEKEMGKLSLAEETHREIIEINKEYFGEKSLPLARALDELGHFLMPVEEMENAIYNGTEDSNSLVTKQKMAGALVVFQEAIVIYREHLPKNRGYPGLLIFTDQMAGRFERAEKWKEAEEMYEDSLSFYESLEISLAEPYRPPALFAFLDRWAEDYENQGKYSEAGKTYAKVLKLQKRLFGEKTFDFSQALQKEAVAYGIAKYHKYERRLYRRCMKISSDSLQMAVLNDRIGLSFLRQNDSKGAKNAFAEAELLYPKTLEIPSELIHTLSSLDNEAKRFIQLGLDERFESTLRLRFRIQKAIFKQALFFLFDHEKKKMKDVKKEYIDEKRESLIDIPFCKGQLLYWEIKGNYAEAISLYRLLLKRRNLDFKSIFYFRSRLMKLLILNGDAQEASFSARQLLKMCPALYQGILSPYLEMISPEYNEKVEDQIHDVSNKNDEEKPCIDINDILVFGMEITAVYLHRKKAYSQAECLYEDLICLYKSESLLSLVIKSQIGKNAEKKGEEQKAKEIHAEVKKSRGRLFLQDYIKGSKSS